MTFGRSRRMVRYRLGKRLGGKLEVEKAHLGTRLFVFLPDDDMIYENPLSLA